MTRGRTSEVGEERTSPNGYRYRRVEEGWELVHRLIAEQKLGRKLNDNEYATFVDGDKTNLKPSNIIVRLRGRASIRRRIAQLNARIEEMTATRDDLVKRLETQEELNASSNV